MARTAKNKTLETAKTWRMRFVSLPISSAGMRPPRPDPGPAWASEVSPDHSQAQRHCDEPRHNPPGEWFGCQRLQPTASPLPDRIGKNEQERDDGGRHENCPGMKDCQESEKRHHGEQNNPEIAARPPGPDWRAFDVHIEIRDDDESDHHQCRNQNPCHERREKVQQLLKTEKVPGCLRGVRSEQRIRKLLQWRVPK